MLWLSPSSELAESQVQQPWLGTTQPHPALCAFILTKRQAVAVHMFLSFFPLCGLG